jgi:hypothetical protein
MVNLDAIIALASMTCILMSKYYDIILWMNFFVNNSFIGKWKLIAYVIKTYLFHDLWNVYIVEALDWNAWYIILEFIF